MQLSITREDLFKPLRQVIGAVERQQTIPALGHVLVAAEDGTLSFTATDLEIELVACIKASFEEEGSTTIPARKLLDICQALPSDASVDISAAEGKVKVQSGRSRFTLASVPVEDFPRIHEVELDERVTLTQGEFRGLIDRASFAMAQQDVRYYLNGLLLEIDPEQTRTVATDGHRLALSQIAHSSEVEADRRIIMPRKGVQELQRLLVEDASQITLSLGKNHVQASIEGLQMTSKLIEGRFPEYQRVLPEQEGALARMDTATLKQALGRVAILCNEKYKGVRLILDSDSLAIQAHNPEHEQAEDEIEIQYSGEKHEIGFNVQYLLDVLNVMETEAVDFYIRDGNSSVLILPAEQSDSRYVVMPMRL
ncbi:MAG: DNA polymerase III subunit beta [Proteobacteria bacterium]|nr:DNA polymerase III subunit beta [Pseudomonadota bacterium]